MSDDNSMDVNDVPLLPPISQSFPMSSSSPPLLQVEVYKLKKQMMDASELEDWSVRITCAGSDKRKLQNVFISVLVNYWFIVSSETALQKNVTTFSGRPAVKRFVQSLNDDEVEEWKDIVQKGDWECLITHPKLWKLAEDLIVDRQAEESLPDNESTVAQLACLTIDTFVKGLRKAYIGDFATTYIKHLEQADIGQETNEQPPLLAKVISVVQSSGTGKSRMLTEVSKQIFTLPICLRKSTDPGYPPGDEPVVKFFSALPNNNDLSVTAHIAIACFLAAAHEMMLETLQEAYNGKWVDGLQLLQYWHRLMEPTGARDRREAFFTKVVERANTLKLEVETFKNNASEHSPIGAKGGEPLPDTDLFEMSSHFFGHHAKKATEKLMEFLSDVIPGKKISVMYFDEAHELSGSHFSIFLRLVQHQLSSTKMWYTFIGTKSPSSKLQLKQGVARLLPPYIDLGFDQRAIAKSKAPVTVRMGDMETIEFLSQYGRPMWGARVPGERPYEAITSASWKLLNGESFSDTDKNHVFAVLSQRLCLDPVISASEATELADRAVAHHMRLLTGFSTNSDRFYTHSPSEPVLVMGSINILYDGSQPDRLRNVLQTLSRDLCKAGLVEKGVFGELGARTLILIARDFAASYCGAGRVRFRPVPLMDFLVTLFGRDQFDHSDKLKLDNAFDKAYVNFTHWISTRDTIPDKLDQKLLANLWARGAALQCGFSQESIYFIIPLYHGSIHSDSIFDPSRLSAVVVQVMSVAGGKIVEPIIRPFGVPRDRHQPLPYLVILMDLDESRYANNGLKIYAAPEPSTDGEFGILCDALDAAVKEFETYRSGKKTEKEILEGLKKKIHDARLAVDSCNRYSMSVCGVSQREYGILREAKIESEFATLVEIIMPLPDEEHNTREHVWPLERLSERSAWMSDYGVSNEEWRW